MNCKLIFIIPFAVLLLSCSSGNQFDPTLFNDGFKGITYTNINGYINGPVDPNDWNLYDGAIGSIISNNDGASFKILPLTSRVGPFPNPTNTIFTVQFSNPVATVAKFDIIDDRYTLLRRIIINAEAGVNCLVWDLRDNRGEKLAPGIYRILYEFDSQDGLFSGYGDIWIK